MSMLKIKTESEKYLAANWNTTPIAWVNIPFNLNPDDYINPHFLEVDEDRELVSHAESFKTTAIFQINIRRKVGLGTGSLYTHYEILKNLFREQNINGVYYPRILEGNIFKDNDYMVLPLKIIAETWNS